jgi:hypothetical protein
MELAPARVLHQDGARRDQLRPGSAGLGLAPSRTGVLVSAGTRDLEQRLWCLASFDQPGRLAVPATQRVEARPRDPHDQDPHLQQTHLPLTRCL